jgi:hypothetical protein
MTPDALFETLLAIVAIVGLFCLLVIGMQAAAAHRVNAEDRRQLKLAAERHEARSRR